MASLTTHILDTANGVPAASVTIEILKVNGDKRVTLRTLKTNEDGRTNSPVLAGDQCIPGVYELVFHIGDYLVTGEPTPVRHLFSTRSSCVSQWPPKKSTTTCRLSPARGAIRPIAAVDLA